MPQTLEELDREIRSTDPDVLEIAVSPADWHALIHSVLAFNFVPATEDRPAFFWYAGRKIVPAGPWRR